MSENPTGTDHFPEDRSKIGSGPFQFHCHNGVSCFTTCCQKLEMYLYPFDIIRLKNALGLHSADFIRRHTRVAQGSHPYFPAMMLNMADDESLKCPFLSKEGCSVYKDRPSACRTYPLERAVEKSVAQNRLVEHYFMTHHSYCKGHYETNSYTIRQWLRDQGLHDYNFMNDLWAEVDAFFATNPWQGEGKAGPKQQLAFMACYNIDDFRAYTQQHNLLKRFRLDKDRRHRMERDDTELLKFGFDWLQFVLGNRPTLQTR